MRKTTIVGVGIAAVVLYLAVGAWGGRRAPLSAAPHTATARALDEAAAPETDPMPRHALGPASMRQASGTLPRTAAATTSKGRRSGPAEDALVSVDRDVAEADVPGPDSVAHSRLGDPLARLRDRLVDANPARRMAAVHEVAPIGEGAAALQQILRDDGDPRVRASAAVQLGDGKGFAVIRSLLAALDDTDPDVVQQSLGALANIGDASVIADLKTKRQAQTDAQAAGRFDQTLNALGAQLRRMPARPVFAEESRDLAPREESGTAYADSPRSDVATATSQPK